MSSFTPLHLYEIYIAASKPEEEEEEEFDFNALSTAERREYLKVRFENISEGTSTKIDVLDFLREYKIYNDTKLEEQFNIRI